MKNILKLSLLLFTLILASKAQATITLFDWAFNVNTEIYEFGDILPGNFSTSAEFWSTGLGTLTIEYNPGAAGDYSIIGFFDYEIDEEINTFFNEYGYTAGTPSSGLSWEIDEPGFVYGDIYANLLDGTLDNSNGVVQNTPDDVSMALGWTFELAETQSATISFSISDTIPTPTNTFYLAHVDPGTDPYTNLYFSSNLVINGEVPPPPPPPPPPEPVIPEPSTILLVITGLLGIAGVGLREKGKKT